MAIQTDLGEAVVLTRALILLSTDKLTNHTTRAFVIVLKVTSSQTPASKQERRDRTIKNRAKMTENKTALSASKSTSHIGILNQSYA